MLLKPGRWAALALLVAVPAPLLAGGGPGSVNGYGNVGFYAAHGQPGCGGGITPGNGSPFTPKSQPWILQAAPWYLYWPYDAHFQTPAPVFAPYQAPHMLGATSPQAYYPGFGAVPHGGYNGYPTQADPYARPAEPYSRPAEPYAKPVDPTPAPVVPAKPVEGGLSGLPQTLPSLGAASLTGR